MVEPRGYSEELTMTSAAMEPRILNTWVCQFPWYGHEELGNKILGAIVVVAWVAFVIAMVFFGARAARANKHSWA